MSPRSYLFIRVGLHRRLITSNRSLFGLFSIKSLCYVGLNKMEWRNLFWGTLILTSLIVNKMLSSDIVSIRCDVIQRLVLGPFFSFLYQNLPNISSNLSFFSFFGWYQISIMNLMISGNWRKLSIKKWQYLPYGLIE